MKNLKNETQEAIELIYTGINTVNSDRAASWHGAANQMVNLVLFDTRKDFYEKGEVSMVAEMLEKLKGSLSTRIRLLGGKDKAPNDVLLQKNLSNKAKSQHTSPGVALGGGTLLSNFGERAKKLTSEVEGVFLEFSTLTLDPEKQAVREKLKQEQAAIKGKILEGEITDLENALKQLEKPLEEAKQKLNAEIKLIRNHRFKNQIDRLTADIKEVFSSKSEVKVEAGKKKEWESIQSQIEDIKAKILSGEITDIDKALKELQKPVADFTTSLQKEIKELACINRVSLFNKFVSKKIDLFEDNAEKKEKLISVRDTIQEDILLQTKDTESLSKALDEFNKLIGEDLKAEISSREKAREKQERDKLKQEDRDKPQESENKLTADEEEIRLAAELQTKTIRSTLADSFKFKAEEFVIEQLRNVTNPRWVACFQAEVSDKTENPYSLNDLKKDVKKMSAIHNIAIAIKTINRKILAGEIKDMDTAFGALKPSLKAAVDASKEKSLIRRSEVANKLKELDKFIDNRMQSNEDNKWNTKIVQKKR